MDKYTEFYEKLRIERQSVKLNSVTMNKTKYDSLIEKVKQLKVKTKKQVNGITKLISPVSDGDSLKYFIYDEELFEILHHAHVTTGHGGRDRMMKNLRGIYQNITYRDVQIYLNMFKDNSNPDNPQRPRKRRKLENTRSVLTAPSTSDRICPNEKKELINQALAKLIAMNQLPLSFCSSIGFKNFMTVVEPNYKSCGEEIIKRKIIALKTSVEQKVREGLNAAKSVVCSIDCWSSSQQYFITITAHVVNNRWCAKSYTLAIREMEEHHTAKNFANEFENTLTEWGISQKVMTVVTDNTKTIVHAISLIYGDAGIYNVTCAAHTLQLAISSALEEENIQQLIQQCSKLVNHFNRSSSAKQALETKQEQLGMTKTNLLQCCTKRWNTIFLMLDRLYVNRCAISNVIADWVVTNASIAQKLIITESQWARIESLVYNLKPLHVATTLFCRESHSPVSMIRPLLQKVFEKHFKLQHEDDEVIIYFKQTIISELKHRFDLEWNTTNTVSLRHIACFLDPRYKDLEHEPIHVRETIRSEVKYLLQSNLPHTAVQQTVVQPIPPHKSSLKSGLEFLYGDDLSVQFHGYPSEPQQRLDLEFLYGNEVKETPDFTIQFQNYLAEPQLRFDLDPFEWWKTNATKYPAIAELAMKYLAIPASAVSSERWYSTTVGIIEFGTKYFVLP
ncbi:E3 SUMO-protein ligase ZBED1-like [Chrysoperla carnea]|uniref:E3 SUMO-protein ligase ZBED1-like n=1 Tax=Chrysoperla carnea TaxID=189513 RepID=UPI001D096F27|nr:E3 SUMO-protein ligase ZBED1-like [Chrysoperla carnea]